MSANDGGSAFPQVSTDIGEWGASGQPCSDVYSVGGMSLRDWFAGQAMAAVMLDSWYQVTRKEDPFCETAESIASDAYQIADAMLKARAK